MRRPCFSIIAIPWNLPRLWPLFPMRLPRSTVRSQQSPPPLTCVIHLLQVVFMIGYGASCMSPFTCNLALGSDHLSHAARKGRICDAYVRKDCQIITSCLVLALRNALLNGVTAIREGLGCVDGPARGISTLNHEPASLTRGNREDLRGLVVCVRR